jgi:hypothetical protein
MIATLGRRAARDRNELGFGPAVDHLRHAGIFARGPRQSRLHAGLHKLLPNPHDLPLAETNLFGDFHVGAAIRRHQQNLRSSQLGRTHGVHPRAHLQLRPSFGRQYHMKLML